MRWFACLAILGAGAACVVAAGGCGLDVGGLGATAGDDGGGSLLDVASSEGGGSDDGATADDGPGADGDSTTGDSGSVGDSSSKDSSTLPDVVTNDTGVADTGPADTGVVETGTVCTVTGGCYVIPSGWTLVGLAGNQTSACPAGFAGNPPTNLFAAPNTSSACACGACAISTQPSCASGAVQVFYDNGTLGKGQCGSQGQPPQNNNSPAGQCGTDMYMGGFPLPYTGLDLKYVPPPATGGACATPGAPAPQNVTYGEGDRSCVPDSPAAAGCSGNECTPNLPAPYKACVTRSGNAACPGAPFTVSHVVGTGVSFTCSACGCGTSADCSGTMKLFTDGQCKQGELDIAADGQCSNPNAPSGSYGSYIYDGAQPTNVACHPSGSSSAQGVQLTAEETVCCVP